MKIYTENIDIELTMEEFEDVLNKNMLDKMIEIIASLSSKIELQNDGDITSLLNKILQESDEESEEYFRDFFSDDEDDEDDCDFDSEDEDANDTVNRLYYSIFRNGERNREG